LIRETPFTLKQHFHGNKHLKKKFTAQVTKPAKQQRKEPIDISTSNDNMKSQYEANSIKKSKTHSTHLRYNFYPPNPSEEKLDLFILHPKKFQILSMIRTKS